MALKLGPLTRHLELLAQQGFEKLGVIIGRGEEAYMLVAVRNISSHPELEFTGDPWAVVQAHKIASIYSLEVIGVYHTHPCGNPYPSIRDLTGMRNWPYIWVIASREGVKAWKLRGETAIEVDLI